MAAIGEEANGVRSENEAPTQEGQLPQIAIISQATVVQSLEERDPLEVFPELVK